jgi:hypothetical protein
MFMTKERFRQVIKLRLLALVLALALTWYAMNPTAGLQCHAKHSEEHPDEKRREEWSPVRIDYNLDGIEAVAMKPAVDPVVKDIEDLEWPEVIALR